MPNISYYYSKSGEEMGKWPGTSVWTEKGARKEGQMALGKVISKEKLIFYKSGEGYYRFDPTDQTCHDIPLEELPLCLEQTDKRHIRTPVIIVFGGSYFLHRLIKEIGYLSVLDSIEYGNADRLHSMFQFYVLSNRANRHAETWYMHNFTKYLYPKASLASQRISEFLAAIGNPDITRIFLEKHLEYILGSTDREKCVLIDSTGCPNKCSLYVTKLSVHEGEKMVAYRVIAVVQKSTGLPLYFKIIEGHLPDITTVMYVIRMMEKLGCQVDYVLGDAGYCCPAVMERMIWSGIDFMTRLCPHFNIFKEIVKEHLDELTSSKNLVDYHGRKVYVLKLKKVIAHEKDSENPVEGYVYLCRDIQAYHSKIDHLMNSKQFKTMTHEEFLCACDKLGLFAIVTTKNLAPAEILPEYYTRQGIEQFFDFAKNFGRFLPVAVHSMETLNGHMLLAFMATFIICLVEYRLNLVDTRYISVRDSMREVAFAENGAEAILIETSDGEEEMTIEQDILADIFKESAGELFENLQHQMADVFVDEIIPEPIVESNSLYEAFGLHSPFYVTLKDGQWIPVLREGDADKCCKLLAFARKPTMSDEEIRAKREAAKQRKLEKDANAQGFKLTEKEAQEQTGHETGQGKRGRPPGSKNKKTLERERLAAEATAKESVDSSAPAEETQQKRGRGRPPGSKNKKTLERERQAAEAAAKKPVNPSAPTGETQQKRRRGRPPGSKNKRTLERERLAAEAAKEPVDSSATTGNTQQKRGRGRPPGSKNKKTLERERQAAEGT